jgi:oligosaccharyltransferase complex subunit gamma
MLSFAVLLLTFTCLTGASDSKILKVLKSSTSSDGFVSFSSKTIEAAIEHPRTFGVVALLTAMSPRMQCTPCSEFHPAFKLVASSYAKSNAKKSNPDSLFFGILDYDDGIQFFQKVKRRFCLI